MISFILNYALYGNDGKIESDVLSQNQNMNRRNNHFRQWLRWENEMMRWLMRWLVRWWLMTKWSHLSYFLTPFKFLDFWLIIIFQFGFIIPTIQIQIMIKFKRYGKNMIIKSSSIFVYFLIVFFLPTMPREYSIISWRMD